MHSGTGNAGRSSVVLSTSVYEVCRCRASEGVVRKDRAIRRMTDDELRTMG